MFDLSTVEGVLNYLSETPFATSDVTPLLGGTGNYTYRITLREPYVNATVDAPVHTLVFKHAKPYLPGNKQFAIAVERQDYELLAFKHVPALISPSPNVSLPKFYYEDHEQRVIIMSDSGVESATLKALLQTGPLTDSVSHTIGHSLGAFLARLHNSTSNLEFPGKEIKAAFASNTQARSISSWVTYGRIIETLSSQGQSSNLIDPPLDLPPSQIETIATLAKSMQDRIMTSEDVLTMGDFWPGNFLISFIPQPHVDVIDWELAKPGLAGVDVGQALAELECLRLFHPSSRTSVDAIISSFLEAYRDASLERGDANQKLKDIARVAATHMGAHLVTWTPRVGWGSKEQTRPVVVEGVEYLLHSAEGDEAWLSTSVVGRLLSQVH